MALIVAPGASNANAYASLAYVDAYHTERGNAAWTGADVDKEAAIVRATFALDGKYRGVYTGRKATSTQSLEWPRFQAYDANGYAIEDDIIPLNLERAVAEGALIELATPGGLTPVLEYGIKRKREKVDVIEEETEYDGANAPGAQAYTAIDGYLSDLIGAGTGRHTVKVMRS